MAFNSPSFSLFSFYLKNQVFPSGYPTDAQTWMISRFVLITFFELASVRRGKKYTKGGNNFRRRSRSVLMPSDYVVICSEPNSAKILENQEERASLQRIGKGIFNLQDKKNARQSWTLTIKVDGEMRPFSMACYEDSSKSTGAEENQAREACFKIKDHLFSHNNNFYSVGEAIPEGISRQDTISGSKYICRLINFPFSHLDHVDEETKHQMKRYRGIAVGEIKGIGLDGYSVKLYEDELVDIGLQLTASTYVAYTTHAINVAR